MTADLFAAALRHDRAIVMAGLVAVILLAWTYLLLGAGIEMEAMDMGGGQMMMMAPEWTPGYAAIIFAMWAIMMVAMMLPGAAPTILLVAKVMRERASAGGAVPGTAALFVLGYVLVWTGFSLAATLLQWGLDRSGLLTDRMAAGSSVFAGAILLAAGIYQWTPLKEACLRHCRSPLDFLLYHWREGAWGAAWSGVRHGLFCLGCCWMLMGLLFVGGLMNALWIGGIALLVLIEKTIPWGGRVVARATGIALAAAGAAMLVAGA
jgi:predicted metal-binding membrane protein